MKKKQEKEAKEAAERAAKEAAEENQAEVAGKGETETRLIDCGLSLLIIFFFLPAKSEEKVSAGSVPEVQAEAKKEEDKAVPTKGRLSKTSSGPSSGDKDKKLGGGTGVSGANNNNNKNSNKRTERPKSPVGGGQAK